MSVQLATLDSLKYSAALPNSQPVTVMANFCITDITNNLGIFSLGTSGGSYDWRLRGSSTNTAVDRGANTAFGSTLNVNNVFRHWAVTISAAAWTRLYVDGRLDVEQSVADPAVVSPIVAFGNGGGGASTVGYGNGFKIWNRELTAAEIEIESHYVYPVSYVDLWDFWPLIEASDVIGRAGEGRALTVAGSPVTNPDNGPAIWQWVPRRYFFMSPPNLPTPANIITRSSIFRAATR